MEYLNEVGKHHVTIQNVTIEAMEPKDGDNARMAIILECATDDERRVDFPVYFTRQIVANGKNAGRPLYELGVQTLTELGMPEPFNPGEIDVLIGKDATVTMKEDEYKGVKTIKPAFINPAKKRLSNQEAANIWEQITGQRVAVVQKSTPQPDNDNTTDDDDLVF